MHNAMTCYTHTVSHNVHTVGNPIIRKVRLWRQFFITYQLTFHVAEAAVLTEEYSWNDRHKTDRQKWNKTNTHIQQTQIF